MGMEGEVGDGALAFFLQFFPLLQGCHSLTLSQFTLIPRQM